MKIKTIIFDFDGTLIDSSKGIVESFNFALRKFNLPEQPAQKITPMIGFPVEQMFAMVTDENIPALKKAFRDKAIEKVVEASVPLDGAEETIVSLFESGFKLGIATTKIRKHIDGVLSKFDWHKYFHSVIGGDEVKNVKPHPEPFETLLQRMNAEKESSVVVGDTINDLLGARALNMPTVAVRSPYGTTDDVLKLKPEYFIESISELTELLAELNSNGIITK